MFKLIAPILLSAVSVLAWDTIIPASTFSSSSGFVANPLASQTFPSKSKANFCNNIQLIGDYYWCYNTAIGSNNPSLTFTVNIPADGTYIVGVVFSNPLSAANGMTIQVDNTFAFGALSTPQSANYYQFVVGTTKTSAVLTAGSHQFTLTVVAAGSSFHVDSILVGDLNTPMVVPTLYTLPVGTVIIPADTFSSFTAPTNAVISGNATTSFVAPNAVINGSYVTSAQINFCQNQVDVTSYDWCYNSPSTLAVGQVGSSQWTITYTIPIAVQGSYYFALQYSTVSTSQVTLIVDALSGAIGQISTPNSGGAAAFAIASAQFGIPLSPGNHTFTILVNKGNIRLSNVLMATSPITAYAPVYTGAGALVPTTIAPTTAVVTSTGTTIMPTTGSPYQQQVMVSGGAVIVLDAGAIAGIVIGAIAFVLLLAGLIIFLVRKNNSKEEKGVPEVKQTPRTRAANKA